MTEKYIGKEKWHSDDDDEDVLIVLLILSTHNISSTVRASCHAALFRIYILTSRVLTFIAF